MGCTKACFQSDGTGLFSSGVLKRAVNAVVSSLNAIWPRSFPGVGILQEFLNTGYSDIDDGHCWVWAVA